MPSEKSGHHMSFRHQDVHETLLLVRHILTIRFREIDMTAVGRYFPVDGKKDEWTKLARLKRAVAW